MASSERHNSSTATVLDFTDSQNEHVLHGLVSQASALLSDRSWVSSDGRNIVEVCGRLELEKVYDTLEDAPDHERKGLLKINNKFVKLGSATSWKLSKPGLETCEAEATRIEDGH